MSDSYEEFCKTETIKTRVCGVAYTLNDEQPVLCTYIGDQPLFYMDDNITDEELHDEFDMEELGFLADEIKTLKEEIAGLDAIGKFMPEDTMKSYREFSENADSLDVEFSMTQAEKSARLAEIKETLAQSRLAAAYMNIAEKYNVEIMISDQVEHAHYDRRSGTILVHPYMDLNDQILLVARELRRHWQHRQGVLINPLTFQPEHAILINRAQEADLAVSVIRTAWELQLAGKRDVWERVENSPMADLGRAFAREAFLDFRTINNGVAAAAAFESWFLSERCRGRDRKIIQAMLADYNGYVFESTCSSEQVTAELIARLGEMPFGKNYLSIHAPVIMDDPIFAEVRDRSNANFLWFIKFERSYKETEQHLQTESDLSTHDIRHDLLNQNSQDKIHERTQSADIIQLFEYQPEPEEAGRSGKRLSDKQRQRPRGRAGTGADIIDLKRWSSER